MAPRKSSRRRDPPTQTSPDDAQDTTAQAHRGTKRKNLTEQKAAKSAGTSNDAKSRTIAVGVGANTSILGALDMRGQDRLSSLSVEILDTIADSISEQPTISALSRTSKRFYALMAPRLYSRVAVAAMFHAHIAKLIRTIEPHLTIEQKSQLKREGKYKGQQEKYPSGLDEKRVPICAGYVRQLIIGVSDPGKKHKYIVDRYYEEALKNMKNLSIVETRVVNDAICEAIASLTKLKALAIHAYGADSPEIAPLARIKDLKHLSIHIGYHSLTTGQSIIHNSMSTLQSLDMVSDSGLCHYFQHWEKNLKSSGYDTVNRLRKGPDLPSLRSLHIEGLMIDEEFIKEFPLAIEFSKLCKFTSANLRDPQTVLWPLLTNLVTSCKYSDTALNLRSLSIDMHDPQWHYEVEQQGPHKSAAKCEFIASFDTLTTLELPGYGQYRSGKNPGLSSTLIRAITSHKNLRCLRISYIGIMSDLKIPYLDGKSVGNIIDGLPHLREFEFAPDELHMDEISRALCRGSNLESVTCFPHETLYAYPRPDPLGTNILSIILSTFISNAEIHTKNRKFVWEDYYKLNRLDLKHKKWDIASAFGKRKKGYGKPDKIQAEAEDGIREVWYQSVPETVYIHVGYDPTFEWVTKVEKQIE